MAAGLACAPALGCVSAPFFATNTNTRADAASAAMLAPSKALVLRFLVPAPVSQGGPCRWGRSPHERASSRPRPGATRGFAPPPASWRSSRRSPWLAAGRNSRAPRQALPRPENVVRDPSRGTASRPARGRRAARAGLAESWGRLGRNLHSQLGHRFAVERDPARQQLEEDDAERPDVRPRVDLLGRRASARATCRAGEPMRALVVVMSCARRPPCVVIFEMPKSSTLIESWPSARRMQKRFAGFRSRWTMPSACASAMASHAWSTNSTACSTGIARLVLRARPRGRPPRGTP